MNKTSKCLYKLNYHLIFCPKYRKACLTPSISTYLEKILNDLAKLKDSKILNLTIQPDHVHIFFECTPKIAPSMIVKTFKGISARYLLRDFPELKKQFYEGNLWSRSYFLASHGNCSSETIQKYIEDQKHD